MRMEVQPGALTDAGTRQSEIAGQLTELSGRLTTAADAASAAGDPAVEEAMTGAVQSWQASLGMVSHSVGSIGSGAPPPPPRGRCARRGRSRRRGSHDRRRAELAGLAGDGLPLRREHRLEP